MKSIVYSSLFASALAALPNVTPIPALYPGTCTSYPNWINTRDNDVTGSWMLTVSNAEDTTLNNLLVQPFYDLPWGSGSRNILGADYIPAGVHNPAVYFRCFNGQPTLGSNLKNNVTISKDMRNADLVIGADKAATYVPQLYYLEGEDGKRLDGVYLGAQNKTTWGFVFQDGTCGANGKATWPFMEVKLLDLPVDENYPPKAGGSPESKGFIKVIGW